MPLPDSNEIAGVKIKPLVTHGDDRGFFREIVRITDDSFLPNGFAQWSHSLMQKDVVKAWHYHHVQYDWWYVGLGQIEVVLYDNREESPTYQKKLVFRIGESKYEDTSEAVVCIPPGVLHACRVLSDSAHLFYITSECYNTDDEGRFPYNAGPLEHDWGPNPIVAENDKKSFIPKNHRELISSVLP